MASIKVLLWKKNKKKQTHPIVIRIIKNRKPSYIYTGQYIKEEDWDELEKKVRKSHPNSKRLNHLIAKKLAEANDQLLELEASNQDATSKNITAKVKKKVINAPNNSFFQQANTYLENLQQEGKYNRYVSDKPRIKRFKAFLKDRDIAFDGITVTLLKQFKAYLKGYHKVGERTAINYLIVIRTIFNEAIKSGIVEQKFYPFGKGKVQIKFPDSVKIGLTVEEVEQLEAIDLTKLSKVKHARNVWLISYYLAGVRVSDVFRLRWSDFKDGRLHYLMGKNNKSGSIKLYDKVYEILEDYKETQRAVDDLVFPELKKIEDFDDNFLVQRKISYATKNINKYLKQLAQLIGLEKKLTMHISRHTFGSISGDRIPIQMLQKLYRHTDITTTIAYQKAFTNQDTDDALEAVLKGNKS